MIVTKNCPFTGEPKTMDIDVTDAQMKAWKDGELIQHVMPNLTADEREFLISGITRDVWELVVGKVD
jgi:hypothetical protein